MQRYGQTAASSYGLIDNLTFTLGGNQLSRVDDAAAASAYNGGFEFKDGVKQANEYTYDSNGNLTKDLNKGISNISYNCLNLPSAVTFSDGSTIAYTYGADGTKLKTVHKIGSTTTTTDYCGNVIYENGVQKLLLTEEGYVTLSDGKYHYYLKDHQGNNRVVINQSGTVEEANHYYPFGGVFASSGNVQPYKYNGKEYDSKKGLNWYDYGARHYDAVLGRFTTNDRFAEKYYSMSPYQYGANSPVGNIDVNGDSIRVYTETQSFGHTWISVGEGSNMTVYSYGRYNGTNKGPDRSSNSLGNGSGVLLKLMGDEAKAYNDKKAAGIRSDRKIEREYPDAGCTLDYDQAWKLLVSVRLAAQCTDARVNVVVQDLYAKYPDVAALAAAEPEAIEAIVRPCGLGKSKARDISACMRILHEQYHDKVPEDFNALLKLPGVGRKSANLIMGDVFGKPAIVTDTHCIRLSNRIGLVHDMKDPKKVEMALWKIIPPEEGNDLCHRLVNHGREVCTARTKPYCDRCCLNDICEKNGI